MKILNRLSNSANFSSIMLLIVAIIGYTLKYTLSAYIANNTSAANFGDYMLALKLLDVTTLFFLLGTATSSKRFLAQFIANNDYDKAYRFIQWNTNIIKRSLTICSALVASSILIVTILHYLNIKNFFSYHTLIYAFWVTPFFACTKLLTSYLASRRNVILANTLELILRFLLLMSIFLISVEVFGLALNQTNLLSFFFGAILLLLIIDFTMVSNHFSQFRKTLINGIKQKKIQPQKEWLQTSFRLIINSSCVNKINGLSSMVILEIITHDEHLIGYYAAILTITNLYYNFSEKIYQFICPQISFLLHEKHLKELQGKLNTTNLVTICFMATLLIITIYFGGQLLSLFGPEYAQVYPVLITLSAGQFIVGCSRGSGYLLAYGGKDKWMLATNLLSIVFFFILSWILVSLYGLLGAGLAASISAALRSIVYIIKSRLVFGIKSTILL